MSVTRFKVGGKEFVIVPRREYDRIAARLAEDARDASRARKAMEKFRAGKLKTVPHKKVKQMLGL